MSRRRRGGRAGAWLVAGALLCALSATNATVGASVWPSSHERVARALQSTDAAERRAAAGELLSLPPEIARPLTRKALLDPDADVRLFSARAAAVLGLERGGDVVISWLSDSDSRLRAAACELIEVSPTPASVGALARVLGDANPNVRRAAAAAMGGSGSADVVAPLLGHLDDTVVTVRLEVVRALGRVGDRRAVVPLVSKLQDAEAEVREAAARALGGLGDARAVATLMLALQDGSDAVRSEALEALGTLRATDAVSPIAALLSGPGAGSGRPGASGGTRDAALRALGRIGTQDAIQILLAELEREVPVGGAAGGAAPAVVRHSAPARSALVLAGDRAVEPLRRSVRTAASERLASGAALALAELGAEQASPDIIRAAQRGTVSLDAAFLALAQLGDHQALPFLLEYLDDPDGRVRRMVVVVAGQLLDPKQPDGRVVDPVRPRVTDVRTSMAERVALVGLLGRTGSTRAAQVLISLARIDSPPLRLAVVEALGELGQAAPAVDEILFDAISAPPARLRLAAAKALGRVGKDGAARRLLHALGVAAEQDRGAIGIALSGSLARSRDGAVVERARTALAVAPAGARDALIEGLGRMPTTEAGRLLAELSTSAEVDDRRKVAEALCGHPGQQPILLRLLSDPDPTVRANAAWSLGRVGKQGAKSALREALGDLDVAVSGNAAVSLARVAQRSGAADDKTKRALCGALDDFRPYVRANALVGLRFVHGSCQGRAHHLLLRDRSWRVRQAAAELLRSLPTRAPAEQRELATRALARCSADDKDATVAARCARARAEPGSSEDVLVFVVPHGRTKPLGRAPFALERPDGALRLGVADRRGALLERDCPGGKIRLAVPAALAR